MIIHIYCAYYCEGKLSNSYAMHIVIFYFNLPKKKEATTCYIEELSLGILING